MPDHIHILVGLHSTLLLAEFIKVLKTSTNSWMKENGNFPYFESWGEKYGAFTCFYKFKKSVIEYIKNQREHHKEENFADEYRRLIEENGVEIDERYFLTD
jgi:REP element-mobilizing transposase RayT